MKVKSESEVAQSCLTLSDPMDCSLPGSSVHGIFQARVPEWGAIAFYILWPFIYIFACSFIKYYFFKSIEDRLCLYLGPTIHCVSLAIYLNLYKASLASLL